MTKLRNDLSEGNTPSIDGGIINRKEHQDVRRVVWRR